MWSRLLWPLVRQLIASSNFLGDDGIAAIELEYLRVCARIVLSSQGRSESRTLRVPVTY
jgi:hypothetical protein